MRSGDGLQSSLWWRARGSAILLGGLLVGTLVVPLRAEDAPRPAAGGLLGALPRETVLLVRVSSLGSFQAKLKASPIWKLKEDPEMKGLVDQFSKQADAALAEARTELGFDPLEFLGSFEGECILAVGGLEGVAGTLGQSVAQGGGPSLNPEVVPFVIAGDAGGSAPKVRECLDKLFAFAEREGAVRQTVSIGAGKITVLSDDEKGGAAPPSGGQPSPKFYIGDSGSRFYLSTSRAFLEKVMGAAGGEGVTGLAANPLFQECQRMAGDGDFLTYVNLKQLSTSLRSALSATFLAFYWQKIEALVFGQSLNCAALSLGLNDTGVRQGFFVHNSGAGDGILGVFKGPAFPASPSSAVPRSSQIYGSMSFNPQRLGQIIKEVFILVSSFAQPNADIEVLCEQGLGVKFSDLMGSLGNRFSSFGQGMQADQPLASASYMLELSNDGVLKKVLDRWSAAAGGSVQKESYKDREILTMSLGGMGDVAVCVTDKTLLVTGSKANMQVAVDRIAGGGAGLADDPEFQKLIASKVPAKVNVLSYSSRDYMQSYFESMSQLLSLSMSDNEAQAIKPLLGALGGAFGASYGYAVWTENGLHGESTLLYK